MYGTRYEEAHVLQWLRRGYGELKLLAQDPVLLAGLLLASTFILAFIAWPLLRVMVQGFFTQEGAFSLEQFRRYIDPSSTRYYRQVFYDTLRMGLLSASLGTALGFLFAYSYVRCNVPFKPLVHILALLPTISPLPSLPSCYLAATAWSPGVCSPMAWEWTCMGTASTCLA
jgi:iron(III) transport system permease protein